MGDGKKSAAISSPLPARAKTHYPLPITHYLIAAMVAMMLAGCGTVAKRDAPRGGYYLDDGPGENPPANLDSIPDAVPRFEPLHRGASRPYAAMGRNYTPMTSFKPYKARGLATWYGRRYHGRQTSSGEAYDMYAMTAAHTTLPIPSYARVTHLENGKSVVVRINDRGPFVGGRLIDLSYTAAHKLGIIGGGSAMVQVESILPGSTAPAVVASAPSPPVPAARPAAETAPALREPDPIAAPLPAPEPQPAATAAPQIPVAAGVNGIYLQLGAFGSRQNAETYLAKLKLQMEWLAEHLHVFPRDGLYRVHAGPYASHAEARQISERIGQAFGSRPMVLVR
jgi:rare lipoprotein A